MSDQAAAKIIDLYQRHASSWATRRGQKLQEKAWLDRFIRVMPVAPSILDIGCGSGLPIGRYLSDRGCKLTGIDSAPEMLAMARANLQSATLLEADMRKLSLGKTFDGIIAWNSVFHLSPDDQRAMFPIFARHAKPRTALMFTSGPAEGVAMGELQGEPLYHASLSPDEYRCLLRQNGFTPLRFIPEDPECRNHSVWLAQA